MLCTVFCFYGVAYIGGIFRQEKGQSVQYWNFITIYMRARNQSRNMVVVPASQPGYIGWRNRFLGIDSWAPLKLKNTFSVCYVVDLHSGNLFPILKILTVTDTVSSEGD